MEKEERFLPVGTVVLLKGGTKELMITGYCIMPQGEAYNKGNKVDVKGKMFDYGACFYPEGIITTDQLFVFNHDQIEKICYKGYETDTQKEISRVLNLGIEKMKESMEEGQAA